MVSCPTWLIVYFGDYRLNSTGTFSLDVIFEAHPGGPNYAMYVEVLMLSRRSFRVITSSCLEEIVLISRHQHQVRRKMANIVIPPFPGGASSGSHIITPISNTSFQLFENKDVIYSAARNWSSCVLPWWTPKAGQTPSPCLRDTHSGSWFKWPVQGVSCGQERQCKVIERGTVRRKIDRAWKADFWHIFEARSKISDNWDKTATFSEEGFASREISGQHGYL